MPYNPLEGFKLGQELGKAKKSSFARMSEGVLSDFDEAMKEKRKYGYEVALAGEKARAEAAATSEIGNKQLETLMGGGTSGGKFPAGAKATIKTGFGSVDYPLNRELTVEEAKSLSSVPGVVKDIQDAKRLIQDPSMTGGNKLQKTVRSMAIDTTKPIFVGGKSEELQGVFNRLLTRAFAIGGKTLSESEKGIIRRLLSVTGKDTKTALADLDTFERKFTDLANLISGGENSVGESFSRGGQDTTPREKYNQLRASGMSPEEARREAGI